MTSPKDSVLVSGAAFSWLGDIGLDTAAIAKASPIAAAILESGNVRITTKEFFDLWSLVSKLAGDQPDLGLCIGERAVGAEVHVSSFAALQASTFGEAITILGRYKRLICPEELELEVARGEASIRFHWVLAEDDVPRFLVDSTFSFLCALARRGTGTDLRPLRLELARRPRHAALLRAHFGCAVHFSAPADRIVFAEPALASPFVSHDPALSTTLLAKLSAAWSERDEKRSFADDVRTALASEMAGKKPTLQRAAKHLATSARTLQRRLEEEGTSFATELAHARRVLAKRLLANTDLDVVEIAFLLGFEEPNSFARAFVGWEGVTPGKWRRTQNVLAKGHSPSRGDGGVAARASVLRERVRAGRQRRGRFSLPS